MKRILRWTIIALVLCSAHSAYADVAKKKEADLQWRNDSPFPSAHTLVTDRDLFLCFSPLHKHVLTSSVSLPGHGAPNFLTAFVCTQETESEGSRLTQPDDI